MTARRPVTLVVSSLSRTTCGILLVSSALAFMSDRIVSGRQPTPSPLPSVQLSFGAFTARFVPGPSTALSTRGTFTLEGEGWPAFKGSWKADDGQIELLVPKDSAERRCLQRACRWCCGARRRELCPASAGEYHPPGRGGQGRRGVHGKRAQNRNSLPCRRFLSDNTQGLEHRAAA